MIPLDDAFRSRRPPYVAIAVILICSSVFLWQLGLSEREQRAIVYSFGLIPAVLLGSRELTPELVHVAPPVTLVTSMFLHGGWFHVVGNMLYLWVFAKAIESRFGHVAFIVFYLTCGLAAAAAQIAPDTASPVPMIGASGAISGVLGGYLILFPQARILVLVPISCMFIHHIRAIWLLGLWFIVQLVSAVGGSPGAGVAWWAHIGGFVAGLVLAPIFAAVIDQPRRRRGPWER